MPRLIESPTTIEAAGSKRKRIDEYIGHVNSGHAAVRVAHMVSPEGWVEPGQWIRYSTPAPGGAEYIAICLPAFSPEIVHRDAE